MAQQSEDDIEAVNRMVMAQRAAIHNEIAANQAIISEFLSFEALEAEYAENRGFLLKIPYLAERFRGFRRVRGDGNCFYRAFLYSLLEQFIE